MTGLNVSPEVSESVYCGDSILLRGLRTAVQVRDELDIVTTMEKIVASGGDEPLPKKYRVRDRVGVRTH